MVTYFGDVKVQIPDGYEYEVSTGLYIDGDGVRWQLVGKCGWQYAVTYYLETVRQKDKKIIPLDIMDNFRLQMGEC